jgi:hypothetical protein
MPHAISRPLRIDSGALTAWGLGFALLAYSGLKGGGYDVVVRSQIGIAVWWIVALGALVGVVAVHRLGLPLTSAITLLAAFTVWAMLSATWSESSERAVSDATRDITLLGAFVLAAATIRRRHGRFVVQGMLAAIVLVAALACLSRLRPTGLDGSQTGRFLPNTASRLSYGLNYWNALAAFAAMGVPLALAVALDARTLAGRALANATVPLLALTVFLTLSRGAIVAGGAGLVIALALTRHRVRWLGSAGLGAVGAAILIKAAMQREAVREGMTGALAQHEGSELLAVAVVVIAAVALVHTGLSLTRSAWPGALVLHRRAVSSRARAGLVAGGLVVAVAMFLAVGGPHHLADGWSRFKDPQVGHKNGDSARLGSASGNGRYQYWVSASRAFESEPLHGIGGGSFETWWSRQATLPGHVRNAHSLYMETLAELGLVGILLLGGLIALVLSLGSARSLAGPIRDRAVLAGATAAAAAFAAAAAVDWIWQLTVLPMAFLLLAAVVLSPSRHDDSAEPGARRRRAAIVLMAILGVATLVPALAAAVQLRSSQQSAGAGRLDAALSHADSASRTQPYALSPPLQRALVLEERGDLTGAAAAAAAAERREPTNWLAPFVLARVEAERGRAKAGVAALRRAKALNKTASFLG